MKLVCDNVQGKKFSTNKIESNLLKHYSELIVSTSVSPVICFTCNEIPSFSSLTDNSKSKFFLQVDKKVYSVVGHFIAMTVLHNTFII